MTKQKECVFQVVTSNPSLSKPEWTKLLTDMAVRGEMDFTAESKLKYDTEKKLHQYCSGLLNNWLRKDVRLGGQKPTPKPKEQANSFGHLKLVD